MTTILRKFAELEKQLQICIRKLEMNELKVSFTNHDRWFIAKLTLMDKSLLKRLSIVSPETVVRYWQKRMGKRWYCPGKSRTTGRPRVKKYIRDLVIKIKKLNTKWGNLRISGELQNLSIDISKDSVRRIIQKGRKTGEVLPTGSWKTFLKSHWNSLYACDFMTVETLFGFRFYLFSMMRIKDRKIVRFSITKNPNMNFLKNQFRAFRYDHEEEKVHLIHDNSGELKWFPYQDFKIKEIRIPPYSPNMNTFIERYHRSIRQELLDHFIIMNYRHLRNLVKEYVNYYNSYRPHQGLHNRVPNGSPPQKHGKIESKPILFGLQHQFYRVA